MGGCRCTYRNCTVRTDGTTHMFHYPVFDKVRCHQWLTNAHKLEFLNLKVSQLKNRVVCQHHFKYEYFMNFKKDKLTFEAIPTLDGPYCDSSQYADKNISQEVAKMYPISLDDIETEYLTLYDKKANFSVKYGDFLTNCEVMDVEPVNTNKTDMPASTKCQDREQYKEELSLINLGEDVDKTQNTTINMSNFESTNDVKQIDAQSTLMRPNMYQLINPVVVGIEFDEMPLQLNNEIEKSTANNNNTVQEVAQPTKMVTSENKIEAPKKNKIKILSEKKIANPVAFTGKLEPVSPTQILQWPDRRKNSKTMSSENYSPIIIKTENKPQVNIISSESKPSPVKILSDTTTYPPKTNEITLTSNETQLNNSFAQTNRRVLKNTVNNEVSPGKSLLKPKINSDRVAAIEKKRKFNMKLRDIVESCLDKIDDSDKEQVKNQINVNNDDRVSTFLSNGRGTPSVQDYTIACLEARMKRMEDVLLNKIDQNTQKIVELKNSLTTTSDKKSNSTQVTNNEEFHKKQLYSEISKYLSADVNSLIYEELFINKYVPNTTKSVPSPKKRRRR